jgi:ubiquinone/menaquinone biosynthesis C-methylase UbiE
LAKEIKVDLGCGYSCKEGFIGLDQTKYSNDVKYVVDLNKGKLPFASNSVDAFYSSNVLEHLDDPMKTIRECYRCLKVGGTFQVAVPYFSHPNAVGPGHKNYWNFSSLTAFDDTFFEAADMKWTIKEVSWDKKVSNPVMRLIYVVIDFIINRKRQFYESYLSRVFPIGELRFIVEKRA